MYMIFFLNPSIILSEEKTPFKKEQTMSNTSLCRQKLSDGIYFNHVYSDVAKNDYVSVYLTAPLSARDASMTALLSAVMLRATKAYPDTPSLNGAFMDCYNASVDSDVFKCGETQILAFCGSCLSDRYSIDGESILEKLASIMSQIIFSPLVRCGAFKADILKQEKQNCIDRIHSRINSKSAYAKKRLIDIMCREEAYSTDALGDEDTISSIGAKELYGYYKKLISSARVEIFHVGSSSPEKLKTLFEKELSSVERAPEAPSLCKIIAKADKTKTVSETDKLTQTNVAMGFRTGITYSHPDYAAFVLFNAVFGGSVTGKLFTNVREKMSLCYSIGSRPDLSKGIITVSCGIEKDKLKLATDEILNQLDLIKQGDITADEMEQSKNALINSLQSLEETPSSIADWYIPRILCNDSRDPGELIKLFEKVDKNGVSQAAKHLSLDTVYSLEPEKEEENA
ncbi:MAG: insulinase family protein [Ruminococcaceae bacterium]|nr:insulinase family protein [Oscillospiraceae bacterium]